MRAILTYHSIDPSGSAISVSTEQFDAHVRFLAASAISVVPLTELRAASGDAVALTFDDGFENFATEAWPRLRDAGLPATLFVVSERVGSDNTWGEAPQAGIPILPLLGWDDLGRLADEGVELGGHSRTHPHLEELSAEALADEVDGCREDLRTRCGVESSTFAYPFGTFPLQALRGRWSWSSATLFTNARTTVTVADANGGAVPVMNQALLDGSTVPAAIAWEVGPLPAGQYTVTISDLDGALDELSYPVNLVNCQ